MIEFKFLGLDGNIDEGQVTQIYVKVGDEIQEGQDLFELEAEKLSQAVKAQTKGKIGQINVKVGDIIKKGDIFATSETNSNNVVSSNLVGENSKEEPKAVISSSTIDNNSDKKIATPVARKMARDLGININIINGTGPNGRVLKSDILNNKDEIKDNNIETKPIIKSSGNSRAKMSPTRIAISNAMVKSVFTIPHTTLMIDVNVTSLANIRSELKVSAEQKSIKLTYMAFFVKAIVMALKKFPILNAKMDDNTNEIIYSNDFNIGMATDTEKGLMVPVIHNADQLSLYEIAQRIQELAAKTRDGKITPSEMKNGTFTITNYGSVGLKYGTPVINYPESAILGIGAIVDTPVVINNSIRVAKILPLSISIDHRIIDGADAGRFLKEVKYILEKPTLIFVEGVN